MRVAAKAWGSSPHLRRRRTFFETEMRCEADLEPGLAHSIESGEWSREFPFRVRERGTAREAKKALERG
ncbi:hypothetical protein M0R89_09545 [Halorussus limi]|uniref:Uncharacterized protein n=1 Tax=Halorussus limi TaxID=2938695 RepID=A0A8U0HPX4_9EURY|nr:hypothetical protein [Halorussus limi]UPV72793.1 hypothetical protein M0R89_09545 [Halorussus limi]